MALTLEETRKVIDAAQRRATEIGIRVTVAIVDDGGLLQALSRMDGAPPLSSQIAECKASGAALTLRDGGSMAQMHQDRPAFFALVSSLTRVPAVPGLGSVLIKKGGAIGVSGGKPEQDLDCAEAGLRAL